MIIARGLKAEDLSVRVEWFNSGSIYRQMPIEPPFTLAGTQKWFSNIVTSDRRRDFAFDLTEDSSSEVVAMGGLVEIDHRNQRAELYVLVNPHLTGKGIGKTVVGWMCRFGFRMLNLNRIYLYTIEGNDRARRFYERLGFRSEGVLRDHLFHNGKYVDRHIQGILKKEWVESDLEYEDEFSFLIDENSPAPSNSSRSG